MVSNASDEQLLGRITVNPGIFGGKPIVRGRRLSVEQILAMLAAGDTPESLLRDFPFLERDDIRACLLYAQRLVAHERVEPVIDRSGSQSSGRHRPEAAFEALELEQRLNM